MKHFFLGLLILGFINPVISQEMSVKPNNYSSFSPIHVDTDPEVISFNPNSLQDPELGKIFPGAPCEDCFEVLEKRTEFGKYFLRKGKNGTEFLQQSSIDPMHYPDPVTGTWKTVYSFLRPNPSQPGVFHAAEQLVPVELNTASGQSQIGSWGTQIRNNRNLKLVQRDANGVEIVVASANWSDYSAGDDGLMVYNIFPGIDMEIRLGRGSYKTNFILNQPVTLPAGSELRIRDEMYIDPTLTHTMVEGQRFTGNVSFYTNGTEVFQLETANVFEMDYPKETNVALEYQYKDGNLDIIVPATWLNRPGIHYPVVVDPLLTGTNSMAITGSQYNAVCFTNGCQYNMAVPIPAAVTITDIRWTFNYLANGLCWMSDGAVDFMLGNCRSPNQAGFYWFCNTATAGTCQGSNISMLSHVAPCVPAPQCAGYNMNFTMRFYRCYGSGNGCANVCISAALPWTMVVEGRTVETASISGGVTICQGQSANLTAQGTQGVAPYTYVWNPGNLPGQNVTVTPAVTTNYTVTITDACGNTSTGNTAVTVVPSTNPGFTITPNPACVGQTVTISGLGNSPAASYDWTAPNSSNPAVNNTQTYNVTYANAGTYNVTLNFQNGNCVFPVTQPITISQPSVPSVSIAANPGTVFCAGTNVTFTATPTNGGTSPSYQWQVNGVNVGGNSNTYSSNTLPNGAQVTVIMTSNAPCASPVQVTSNVLTMTVTNSVTPSVSITANPGNTICTGTNVTFTATPVNGGTNPSYQWQVNGVNVGTNSPTFSSSTLTNGATVTVILTSNDPCANPLTATSNTITMTVNPPVVPSVSITANPGNSICAGTNVTFTAVPTNGGTNPTYQWQVNGVNVPGNSSTFSSSTLSNGNTITVIMTSNAPCANPLTATSNTITMTVNPVLVPAVNIVANPGNSICAGTNVTFTATPTNGGTTPSYQWQVNGVNVGGNSNTFSSSTLTNGAQVTVILTSNAPCTNPATATSNTITMTVNPSVIPSVSITANPGNVLCAGANVTFTATPANGGTNPSYQWQVNGVNVGTNSPTFSSTTLTNGANVTVVLTSNAPCALPATATSNTITMTINPVVAPSVSITANPGNTICAGANVTFTATPTNGGTTPSYQWQVNGVNVGTNSPTFSSATLTNGANVSVVLTSNAPCANPLTATSNTITMTVNPLVTPSVSIAVSPGNTICSGTNVTFTATPTNGGTTPSYQWQVNGVNVGTNSPTFSSTTLTNGANVTVVMTSNAICPNPVTATSNTITMTVNPVLVPSVSITASPNGVICSGTNVTFTATPTNGGTTPSYQWQVNGVNVGGNSNTYAASNLINGDVVTVILTSNALCVSPAQATSNAINMVINNPVNPAVTISANPAGPVCPGTPITFTGVQTNPGVQPAYQWLLNGNPIPGANSLTYTDNNPVNGGVITLGIAYNDPCANPQAILSNALNIVVTPAVTPTVAISSTATGTICPGDNVAFTATIQNGGSAPQISWFLNGNPVGNNATTLSLNTLVTGDQVTCVVVNTDPCATGPANSNALTFTVFAPLGITASPDITVCPGDVVTLTANVTGGDPNTTAISWSPQGSGNSVSFTANNSGTYTATVTDQCGTPASDGVNITVAQPPVSAFSYFPQFPSLSNQPVQFTDQSSGAVAWQWGFGDGGGSTQQNPSNEYTAAGDYSVVLVTFNQAGCTDTLEVMFSVEDDLSLFIPNAFTPNLDFHNPDFRPYGAGVKAYQIEIFDRWGERIFVSSPAQPGWDGLVNTDKQAPIGVYNYRITVVFLNYEERVYLGMVNLVR